MRFFLLTRRICAQSILRLPKCSSLYTDRLIDIVSLSLSLGTEYVIHHRVGDKKQTGAASKAREKRRDRKVLNGKAESVNEWLRTHQAHDAVCAHARSVLGFYSGR